MSSSIGLGHASKDLAIAGELRNLDPDLEILWIAGHPASDVLREAGEDVLPEASHWHGASEIAESCVRDGQLDLVRYVYRSLPSWASNARLFRRVVKSHGIDIAVGNEAYEVDIPLILGLLRLAVPFVMIFDFVGTDPIGGKFFERLGAWVLNALWSLDGRAYGRGRHSAIFIGELEDVADEPLGWALPRRRRHAKDYYHVVGHVIRFKPEDYVDRTVLRRTLGLGDGPLLVCSVGGTSIGRELLELCGAATGPLRETLPGLRVILVCGPRLPTESVRAPEGVEVRGYVPRLFELYACCDVAVVQCGASSTTELAALGKPFVYFPIEGHFEQEVVAARLARHGVGKRMNLSATTPELLANAVLGELERTSANTSMPLDGARKAAEHIFSKLPAPYTRASGSGAASSTSSDT